MILPLQTKCSFVTILKNIDYSIFSSFSRGVLSLKIMSNEQLVAAYRDAIKKGQEREWIELLKKEVKRRGLNPARY